MPQNVIDLHREVSLMLLKSTRGYAVRTPKGQKEPGHYHWDPKANNRAESEKVIYSLERSEDNLGVHLHGRVVDVDIDSDNPFLMSALDFFLPPTSHIWGRPSRRRTHRLYEITGADENPFDPKLYPFLDALGRPGFEEIKMEVRGGALRNGEYSLLPGSLHPSGEAYEWEDVSSARSTPVSVDLYRVLNAVRFACVAALIAPHWTEGQRNQLCMAVSGFFHRAVSHTEDMGAMSELAFEKEQAKTLLEGIIRISGDDEADYSMRMRTFEQTWDKAEKGEAVQGASSIVKITGDEKMLPMLYSLLVDSPDLREFDEFMEKYAVRNNTSNVIDRTKAGSANAVFVMTVNDFRNSNMHKVVKTGSGEGRSMVNMLLTSKRTLRVDGLAFMPGGTNLVYKGDEAYINLWRGFAIPPCDDSVTNEDVAPFVDYVKIVLADNNPDMFHWIMSWVADIFQKPGRKPGTCLVLVGKPGAGKSFLGASIIRPIIGRNHSAQTNTVESVITNFNSDSSSKLFIQCDEATSSRRHQDANKLKSLITDSTKRVEPKGVNAFEIDDYSRFCFTSNDVKDAVSIVDGQDDRRYTVQHVNEKYAAKSATPDEEKHAFWSRMFSFVESGVNTPNVENLSKVHKYLLQYQYDEKILRKPMDTKARRNISQHSQRGFDDWLMQIAGYENPFDNMSVKEHRVKEVFVKKGTKFVASMYGWPDLVAYKRLEESYEIYRRKKGMTGTTPSYNAQQIKTEFMARGLFVSEPLSTRVDLETEVFHEGRTQMFKQKVRVTEIPKKEMIVGYLKTKYGYEPLSDIDDDIQFEDDLKPHDQSQGPSY